MLMANTNSLLNYKLSYNPEITRKPEPFANSRSEMGRLTGSLRESRLESGEITYDTTTHYISIGSSNRDTVNYPKHYDYSIKLGSGYRNVKSIEMVSAIIPNQSSGNILDEPMLLIDVENCNCIEIPNLVTGNNKTFAILPLKPPTKSSDSFINPELGCIYRTLTEFKNPVSLDRFHISIRDSSGAPFTFGVPNGSTDKKYQNNFVFKIVVEDMSTNGLNRRNVY